MEHWKEHEVLNVNQELPRGLINPLLLAKDSAKQFLTSNFPEDYERSCEGGDHRDCETLRVDVFQKRPNKVYLEVKDNNCYYLKVLPIN